MPSSCVSFSRARWIASARGAQQKAESGGKRFGGLGGEELDGLLLGGLVGSSGGWVWFGRLGWGNRGGLQKSRSV